MHFGILFFFFFQAEDGIRDKLVTGVQTCALPISFLQPLRAQHLAPEDDHAPLIFFWLRLDGLKWKIACNLGFHVGGYQLGRDASGGEEQRRSERRRGAAQSKRLWEDRHLLYYRTLSFRWGRREWRKDWSRGSSSTG